MREYWQKSEYWRTKIRARPSAKPPFPDDLSSDDKAAIDAMRKADFTDWAIAHVFRFRDQVVERWPSPLPDTLSPEDSQAAVALMRCGFPELIVGSIFKHREFIENWGHRNGGLLGF